jgi:SNF2 family DNA or RNA helicase
MQEHKEYSEFIKSKLRFHLPAGFSPLVLPGQMKDFQKFSVHIALEKGKFALFEDCGLGKTFQELVWSLNVYQHTGKPVLNLAPLAVTDQTIREGQKFGIEVNNLGSGNIQITNYEQLDNINPELFGGVVLDESSIIKNHEGSTTNKVIDKFKNTQYKLCGTATPSPNDPMELGNHAEFLGVMSRNEMLSTYFVHDGGNTSSWRIKGHAQDTFWKWVNTWSLMFSKPSDVGFSDDGYNLPPLNFIETEIATPQRDGVMFNNVAVGASDFHREVRMSKLQRLDEVIKIINESEESFVIWVEQDADEQYLKKHIAGLVVVTGSDKNEWKKDKLQGFSNNEFRLLCTKTKIAGYGLNWQNCHNMIFASPDFSFEKLYQAIRRMLRFGQQHTVNAYLLVTDTMQNVIQAMNRKEQQHRLMQSFFIKHTKELYEPIFKLYSDSRSNIDQWGLHRRTA